MRRMASAVLRALTLRLLGLDPGRQPGWHREQAGQLLRDARLHGAARRMGREAAWLARAAGRIRRERL